MTLPTTVLPSCFPQQLQGAPGCFLVPLAVIAEVFFRHEKWNAIRVFFLFMGADCLARDKRCDCRVFRASILDEIMLQLEVILLSTNFQWLIVPLRALEQCTEGGELAAPPT